MKERVILLLIKSHLDKNESEFMINAYRLAGLFECEGQKDIASHIVMLIEGRPDSKLLEILAL